MCWVWGFSAGFLGWCSSSRESWKHGTPCAGVYLFSWNKVEGYWMLCCRHICRVSRTYACMLRTHCCCCTNQGRVRFEPHALTSPVHVAALVACVHETTTCTDIVCIFCQVLCWVMRVPKALTNQISCKHAGLQILGCEASSPRCLNVHACASAISLTYSCSCTGGRAYCQKYDLPA